MPTRREGPREYYERLLSEMPTGAERTVLRVLSHHVGLDSAIQKADLIGGCERLGVKFKDERQVRKVIVDLRKRGIPICASSGDSGYYLASNLEEYREFRGREYVKKIIDMQETVKSMDNSIRDMFPIEYTQYLVNKAARTGQPSMF
jgi:hypothetical protein